MEPPSSRVVDSTRTQKIRNKAEKGKPNFQAVVRKAKPFIDKGFRAIGRSDDFGLRIGLGLPASHQSPDRRPADHPGVVEEGVQHGDDQ